MNQVPTTNNGIANGALAAVLSPLEFAYALAVGLRNRRYDRRGPAGRVSIPVISVGNITAGGTGKTPCVIALVQLLQQMGRKPCVIARGYKSAAGRPNDEELLIRGACPDLLYVADPDRVRAAERVARDLSADVAVLDDGFQHRALARDLDLVLIDALCPFGHGHLLPRGLLREPIDSLARAGAVILTRCDQVGLVALEAIESRIRPILAGRPIIRSRHRVVAIEALAREQSEPAVWDGAGRSVVLFAGIGRPEAFRRTVEGAGYTVADCHWFPDHHHYRSSDLESLGRRFRSADWFLTTEKDAVKLGALNTKGMKIAVVKVAIDFEPPGLTMLESLVQETLAKYA